MRYFLILFCFAFIALGCDSIFNKKHTIKNKADTHSKDYVNSLIIDKTSIKENLPKEYSWYYRDSINRPYEGYIVKGDSIKLYFNFHSHIVIDIFDALDDYEEKTISLNNNFIYKTFSKQTDEGISFYGILYDRTNKNSKRTNCLLFVRTPENVALNKTDYSRLNTLFDNFKP